MAIPSILEAAIDQFGRKGFEGASTRAIAAAAGTTMSSITYHFGSKHGLYLAAADHIAQRIAEMQAPTVERMRELADGSREGAIAALLGLFDSFALMMLCAESAPWARFILREQQEPTEAFERLYGGVMRRMSEQVVEWLRLARPDLSEREARATAIVMFGQTMILRAGRATVCRVIGVETIDDEVAALLRARLRSNLLAILREEPT